MSNFEPIRPVEATLPQAAGTVARQGTPPDGTVTLRTLGSYLLGSREAILTLAAHRETVWLGLMFVMSAALAREYDGEDLLHEPWHLLLPWVASLGTSFLLFGMTSVLAWRHGVAWRGFWSRYRMFLGLYWMTAPLAWLYAIPVERFLSAGDATAANLWFLAIVSIWRVLLITRVLSVAFGVRPNGLFFVVMLFADTVAITLVSRIDVQILAVMGGVRLTEAEAILAATKLLVMLFGVLSWPIWLLGTIVVACSNSPKWDWIPVAGPPSQGISRAVWSLVAVAVAACGLALPWTQNEQQLRGKVERDFRSGRFHEMLTSMSAHRRDEFPPHWDPPPRIGQRGERQKILKVIPAMPPETATWVRQLFLDKFDAALGRDRFAMETLWLEADLADILAAVESQPEGIAILAPKRRLLQHLSQFPQFSSEPNKGRINSLVKRLTEYREQHPEEFRHLE